MICNEHQTGLRGQSSQHEHFIICLCNPLKLKVNEFKKSVWVKKSQWHNICISEIPRVQQQTFVSIPRVLCNAWFQVFFSPTYSVVFNHSIFLYLSPFVPQTFCTVCLKVLWRTFIKYPCLCSVVAIISKCYQTVIKYNNVLFCKRLSALCSCLKAFISNH